MLCTNGADGTPCLNSGTPTGYTGNCGCDCTPATYFSGTNCQTLDPCSVALNQQVCQNGGSPTGIMTNVGPDPFANCGCSCVTDYSGSNCEVSDACTVMAGGKSCENGAGISGMAGSC